MPPTPAPEYNQIVDCLTGIRRKLWLVRLAERSALAIQWGALVALPLSGAFLLREPFSWESRPWTALFLCLLTIGAGYLLFRNAARLGRLNLSPNLVRIAAGITALLAVAAAILLFLPLGKQVPIWSVPAGVGVAFLIISIVTVRMIDNRAAAIYVDQQVGLRERVSTALEMLQAPTNSPMENAFRAPVITSALGACQQVRTAKVSCKRLDSRLYATAALVAIAAACLTLVPPMPARAVPVRKPTIIVVQQTRDLKEVLKEIEEKKLPNDTITPEKIKPLQDAATQLQNGNMSAIESTAILNQAKEELKRQQAEMAAADRAKDVLNQMNATKDLAKAADAMKDAQISKAQGDASAGQQQNAASAALKSAASAMAQQMASGQMSDAQKQELANQLQQAANNAAADPQLQKDLQNAADAARNGDSQQLSQSMESAGQRMGQQSAGNQLSSGAMSRAMSEIDRMQNQNGGGGSNSQSTVGKPGQGGPGDQAPGDGNPGGDNKPGGDQAKGGDGPGQKPGDGSGAGVGQGKGAGGTASGDGSTMIENRGGPSSDNNPFGGIKSFVRIYDPTSIETSGTQNKVGSYINPIHSPSGSMDVMGQADEKDSKIKTYSDVLPEARKQAMDELTRQEYPPQYQDMVRQFYNDAPRAPATPPQN